jgi:hypothetical protein
MIVHVILFSPAEHLPVETRQELLASLASAAREIPSVKNFRIGRRTRHGLPGYEQMMHEDYAYAAIVEFANVDGLKAYLAHPSHARIGAHFTASASRSLAYDYEMVDAADLTALFGIV